MSTKFGERLKGIIENDLHISQRQFCEQFNAFEPDYVKLSTTAVSDYTNADYKDKKEQEEGNKREEKNSKTNHKERGVNSNCLHKLSRFLNVSSDYLLGLTDSKTRDLDARQIEILTGLNADSVEHLIELKKKFGDLTKYYDAILSFIVNDYYKSVINDDPKTTFQWIGLEQFYDDESDYSNGLTDAEHDFLYMEGDNLLSNLYSALDLVFYSDGAKRKFKSGSKSKFTVHYEQYAKNRRFDGFEDVGSIRRKLNTISITYDQLCRLYVDNLKETIVRKSDDFETYLDDINLGEDEEIEFKVAKGNE